MRSRLPAISIALAILLACLAGAARPALARTESEIAMLAGPERQRILEEGARQGRGGHDLFPASPSTPSCGRWSRPSPANIPS